MKNTTLFLIGFVALTISLSACLQADNTFKFIAPGIWRGVLVLEKPYFPPTQKRDSISIVYDQFKPGELPFNFEVTYTTPEKFYIDFINGTERIKCDSIRFGRDRTTARDTYNFYFPEYQSYIHAEVRGAVMQGYWCVTTKDNYRIPFVADAGRPYRFTSLKIPPTGDISGRWATLFDINSDTPEKAVAEFTQDGNHLSGTFRTETGDYRFLEGTVQGRKFWLSCFDGSHAFLFSGNIAKDSLIGEFRSGKGKPSLWNAWRDNKFDLGSPDTLTHLVEGKTLSFKFNTPDGQVLQYPSASFNNKVTVLTIMGTWCPNCRDEQIFLRDFLKENPELAQQMHVVGASFERHKDIAAANAQLVQYRKVMGLSHDIVYAGKANKEEAAAVFPVLDKVIAFPTMIIIDKKGKIRRVHTGFDGPATSKYADFKAEFKAFVQQLTL
jgi:thiol-disulfide isomerase/thioredoxin